MGSCVEEYVPVVQGGWVEEDSAPIPCKSLCEKVRWMIEFMMKMMD